MKKLLTVLCFTGLCTFSKAQQSFNFGVTNNLCLDAITLVYTNGQSQVFELGCEGVYQLDTGENTVDYLAVNKTVCPVGTTEVKLNKNTTAKVVNVGNTIVDDLNGLIR